MRVSVIIPVYNEEKIISDCLVSLTKQTYKDFEVILVNDGSTDETLKVLNEFQTSNFKFRILHQTHKGPGAARNLGAREARGEILVFVDADMTFDKDFVKKLIQLIKDGRAIGTFSKEEFLLNKTNPWAICWNINRGLPKDRMHATDYPDTQKVFRAITKSAFDKVDGFDEKAGYIDDWSLAEKLGIEAVVAPGAKFYHRNPSSFKEVFNASRWMAKRQYKFGLLGTLMTLLQLSLPISILIGLIKSITNLIPVFFIFKIISDLGSFLGILEFKILGKVSK